MKILSLLQPPQLLVAIYGLLQGGAQVVLGLPAELALQLVTGTEKGRRRHLPVLFAVHLVLEWNEPGQEGQQDHDQPQHNDWNGNHKDVLVVRHREFVPQSPHVHVLPVAHEIGLVEDLLHLFLVRFRMQGMLHHEHDGVDQVAYVNEAEPLVAAHQGADPAVAHLKDSEKVGVATAYDNGWPERDGRKGRLSNNGLPRKKEHNKMIRRRRRRRCALAFCRFFSFQGKIRPLFTICSLLSQPITHHPNANCNPDALQSIVSFVSLSLSLSLSLTHTHTHTHTTRKDVIAKEQSELPLWGCSNFTKYSREAGCKSRVLALYGPSEPSGTSSPQGL